MNRIAVFSLFVAALVVGFLITIIMPDEPLDLTFSEGAFFPWLGTLLAALIGLSAALVFWRFERSIGSSIMRNITRKSFTWPLDRDDPYFPGMAMVFAIFASIVTAILIAKNWIIASDSRPIELMIVLFAPTMIYLSASHYIAYWREAR
ncbi:MULTISPECIES: hypothetical protein [Hyphobacterium]|uniref:Uncharacterized protein n=1 Tax=Hyphobacterium vulgare TaxID=1736751 RepID=A0ABV6ZUP2_9PROT